MISTLTIGSLLKFLDLVIKYLQRDCFLNRATSDDAYKKSFPAHHKTSRKAIADYHRDWNLMYMIYLLKKDTIPVEGYL